MSKGLEADGLLRQYVREALAAKANGGSTKLYDQLVSEVKRLKGALRGGVGSSSAPSPAPADQLAALVQALATVVSLLHERRHEQVVKELLDTPLWQVPQVLRLAVLELVTHLVVANGALVQSCLQTLAYSLLPPPGPPLPDPSPGEAWQPAEGQAQVQDEVVAAAEKVLLLVPTSASRLLPLVVANFPHKLRDRNTQCLYLRAAFALAEGRAGAAIREGLLAGVVEHLISLDVEIRWEDIAEVRGEEAKEEEGGLPPEEEPDIFELEGMSELDLVTHDGSSDGGSPRLAGARGGWEGGHALPAAAGGGDAPGEAAAARPRVDETADKLDSMMELTFGHLERRAAAGQLASAWATLLSCFERCVLLTHRSKFTQFLLFHTARLAPEPCCRALLALLLGRLTDRGQPPIARAACAAYAASFLARAAFCPEALVVDSLQRLADWCARYARDEDRRGGLPPIPSATSVTTLSADAQVRHGAFYAACQALLYALCYHMQPLLRPHRARHHHHLHHAAADGAGTSAQHAAAGAAGSLDTAGASGGTPASAGTSPAVRGHERHDPGAHAQQREALAEALRQLFSGPMPHLLQHRLDPLASCARSVVAEFGRQARALGFADLWRVVRDWERRHPGRSHAQRQLELFFPFDPYLLRRSAAHLELDASYVRWQRGHPAGAPRADLESSDSDSEEEEEEEEGAGSELSDEDAAAAGQALSELEDASSSSSSDDDSSDDSSGDSSDDEADDLKRTRFGSVPGSSLGSDYRARKRPNVPSAMRAGLFGAPAASPTLGFTLPHPGSVSSGGSPPFGASPMGPAPGVAPFGSGVLPAFGGSGAGPSGGLHLGLTNGQP